MHANRSENVAGNRIPVLETSLIVTTSLCRMEKFEIRFEEEFESFPVKEFSLFQKYLVTVTIYDDGEGSSRIGLLRLNWPFFEYVTVSTGMTRGRHIQQAFYTRRHFSATPGGAPRGI